MDDGEYRRFMNFWKLEKKRKSLLDWLRRKNESEKKAKATQRISEIEQLLNDNAGSES